MSNRAFGVLNSERPKMPLNVWTNNRVALGKDLVFGAVVLTETGWEPLDFLAPEDLEIVWRAVDHNTSCPYLDDFKRLRDQHAADKSA
jgi:hypothetical protein